MYTIGRFGDITLHQTSRLRLLWLYFVSGKRAKYSVNYVSLYCSVEYRYLVPGILFQSLIKLCRAAPARP